MINPFHNKAQYCVITPLILVAANLIMKGLFLSSNSIAGDEPFSIYIAQMDILSIINQLSTGNNPPLYEILLHFWIKLFGISPWAVRLPSLLFSSATVLFVYLIGKSFLNIRVGIFAAVIFIFSNYHTLFAHEARVYAMTGMLTAMSMYIYLKSITPGKTHKRDWTFLILINILLIYSHYFGFFVLAIQLIHLITHKKLIKSLWKPFLLVYGAIAVAYLPNINILLGRFMDSSSKGTWIKPPDGIETLYNMLWSFSNTPVVTVIAITILLTALIKLLIRIKHVTDNRNTIRLIILWFAFPFFLMFFISYQIPMFFARYLMFVAVGYCLLLAVSADYIIQKPEWARYLIPSLICILFIATTKPDISNKRNMRDTVDKITELTKNGDALVIITPAFYDLHFIYYYDIEVFKSYNSRDIKANIHKYLHEQNIFPVDYAHQIDTTKTAESERIIYLDAGADYSVPGNGILTFFEERYTFLNRYDFYEIFRIYEFRIKDK
jgi:mannosyltransferase